VRVIAVGKLVLIAYHLDGSVVRIDRILYGGRNVAAAFPD